MMHYDPAMERFAQAQRVPVVYDGKRMRKPIQRKAVDYSAPSAHAVMASTNYFSYFANDSSVEYISVTIVTTIIFSQMGITIERLAFSLAVAIPDNCSYCLLHISSAHLLHVSPRSLFILRSTRIVVPSMRVLYVPRPHTINITKPYSGHLKDAALLLVHPRVSSPCGTV